MKHFTRLSRLLGPALAVACATAARAGGDISYIAITIEAESALGHGYFQVTLGDGIYGDPCSNGCTITDSFDPTAAIATVYGLCWFYALAPATLNVNFALQAGAADTQITVTSALVSFHPESPGVVGRASVAMSLTDLLGDGAEVSGLHSGGGVFVAKAGGEVFAELIDGLSAEPFQSNAVDAEFPGGGAFANLDAPDMQLQFKFGVTALDVVQATSTYEVLRTCVHDITADSNVDQLDLLEVVMHWGEPGGEADVTQDGLVGVEDLVEVILNWGSCPSNS